MKNMKFLKSFNVKISMKFSRQQNFMKFYISNWEYQLYGLWATSLRRAIWHVSGLCMALCLSYIKALKH